MNRLTARVFACALGAMLLVPAAANAAPPCAGFADVDAASAFCPDVTWIRNRGITAGCAPGLYCPADVASRIQVAAFLARLGNVLLPQTYYLEQAFGNTNLVAGNFVCVTPPLATYGYPVRVTVDAGIDFVASTGPASLRVDPAYTLNGVTHFFNGVPKVLSVGGDLAAAGSVFSSPLEILPGSTVTFALYVERRVGAADLQEGHCQLRATVTSSPNP